MSGRTWALALTLCLCCGLAAGCMAGPDGRPIFVTPPPAPPPAAPQALVTATWHDLATAMPQTLATTAPTALATATPQALITTPPEALATATPPTLPSATPQALATAAPQVSPTATPQALVTANPQMSPTATAHALATATLPAVATAASQAVATAMPEGQTHVISVPGQPFTFRVPLQWTVQEVASISPGMVLTADWTSPDNWDSPPPAGVVAHVAAVGAQAISADMSDADIAEAARPDQLAAQLQATMQGNCGPGGKLDSPVPIQIAGQPGMWIHCSTTIDGRTMHLAAASAVHGRTTLAVMGLAVDPSPWSELAPVFEQIIKSVQATN